MSRRGRRALLALWIALLAISWARPEPPLPAPEPGIRRLWLADAAAPDDAAATVHLDLRDTGPRDAPALVLIHGSPGSVQDFDALAAELDGSWRVLVPDLPGFGASRQRLDDYSARAHAVWLRRSLDALGVRRAHLVAFSMGGAVALHLADEAPGRVASIAMVGAIGVQELELLGSHHLNRAVHAAQLAAVSAVDWLVPHMGAFDRFPLGVAYARSFVDTDQRPLRPILERLEAPVLIVHGARDPLVPAAAAREHHRIVPQSELRMLDDASHFLLWTRTGWLARQLDAFVRDVEAGDAPRRADAPAERRARAAAPFDPASLPPARGLALLVLGLLLAAGTLVSEDLTCIGAGLLVAQGRIGFVAATGACLAGIVAGDLLLFAAGRWLGRPALRRAPLRWLVSPAALERASAWFRSNGARAILISRFTPGLRLPTYVAAGVLHTRLRSFALWFGLAALLWTPLLVGFAAAAGEVARTWIERLERGALPALIALALALMIVQRNLVPLLTHRGRRLLLGRWRRLRHFEYWPIPVVYAPLVPWMLGQALRHRSLSVFTAVNPAIPHGGLVGESKSAILAGLRDGGAPVAPFAALPTDEPLERHRERVRAFMRERGLGFPVVIKPDAGERGAGVHVVRDDVRLEAALRAQRGAAIVQEFVDGPEFGVFWIRHPDAPTGRVFSITRKLLPEVVGDGRRTLERLILDDRRAVCMAAAYFERNAARLAEVVPDGERVQLVDIGTHSRGAVFLDGREHLTPALEAAVERASRALGGFFFGRHDVRSPSVEAFEAGEFRIVELNGLTSEATHIYDPRHGAVHGWRTLMAQWRLAWDIGAANAAAGAPTSGPLELLRAWREARRA